MIQQNNRHFAVLNINDKSTQLYMGKFNSDQKVIPLFMSSYNNNGAVTNSVITDKIKLIGNIKKLFLEAEEFIGKPIKSIILSIDFKKFTIKDFEIKNYNIEDLELDLPKWNKLIDSIDFKYDHKQYVQLGSEIYRFFVDGEEQTIFNKSIRGKKLDLNGKIYLVNSVLAKPFIELIEAEGINILDVNISQVEFLKQFEIKLQDQHKILIHVKKDGMQLGWYFNNVLLHNDISNRMSINDFIDKLSKLLQIENKKLWQYFNNSHFLYKGKYNETVVNIFDKKYLSIKRIKQSELDKAIDKYLLELQDEVETFVKYIEKETNAEISEVKIISDYEVILKAFIYLPIMRDWKVDIVAGNEQCLNIAKYMDAVSSIHNANLKLKGISDISATRLLPIYTENEKNKIQSKINKFSKKHSQLVANN